MLGEKGPRTRVRGGGGIELNVAVSGSPAGPPIVFVHGYLQAAPVWRKQFESGLARDFRLVALDLRGHGNSEKPLVAEAYTDSKLWADDVHGVLEQLDLRDAVIVGWSYAGYVIADYLRFYGQERFGAIVLVSAVTRRGDANVRNFADRRFAQLFPALFSADKAEYRTAVEGMVDILVADPARIDAATREQFIATAECVPAVARESMQRRNVENDDVLSALTLPALCIHGAQDAVVLRASSEHNARTIPGAKLTTYEGVGHSAFFEDSERFNHELRMLVERMR